MGWRGFGAKKKKLDKNTVKFPDKFSSTPSTSSAMKTPENTEEDLDDTEPLP
jgi:hypothetical protein